MSNIFDQAFQKLPKFYELILKKNRELFYQLSSNLKNISKRGKVKLESEHLKWEINKKYRIIGEYIVEKMELKSVVDFSHDKKYLKLINEIINLKKYIKNRKNGSN